MSTLMVAEIMASQRQHSRQILENPRWRANIQAISAVLCLLFIITGTWQISRLIARANKEFIASTNYREMVTDWFLISQGVPQLILNEQGIVTSVNDAFASTVGSDMEGQAFFSRLKMSHPERVRAMFDKPDLDAVLKTRGMLAGPSGELTTLSVRVQPRWIDNAWVFWVVCQKVK